MQEKTLVQKIFIFVAALAICVLLVLDAVALVQKFGGEKAKEIVGSVGGAPASSSNTANSAGAAASTPKSEPALLDTLLEGVKKDNTTAAPFVTGQYYHELGEYGFGNTMLVPSILFNSDGTFVFSENTGSGMGTCSGTYSISADGATITCNVSTADISCPDAISLTVTEGNVVKLDVAMKKSAVGDSFILRPTE